MSENYNNHQYQNNEEESTLQLADIWAMIWGYKWWYVACVAICLFAVTLYLYRTPSTYIRTTKVIIDESEKNSAMKSIGDITANMTGLRANNTVANEMEALSSPDLMQIVVERLKLETKYIEDQFLRTVELYTNSPIEMRLVENNPQTSFSFIISKKEDVLKLSEFMIGDEEVDGVVEGKLGEVIVTPAGSIKILPTLQIDNFERDIHVYWTNSMSSAKSYCKKLSVTLSNKESTVVVLSLENNFPNRSSDILSSLIDVYNEEWIRNQNRSSKNTSEFINERLVLIEQELGGIENDLKEYKESNKISDLDVISQTYIQESSQYASKSFEVNNQLSIANLIKEYLNNPLR